MEKSIQSRDFNLRLVYFSEYFCSIYFSHINISQQTQKFSRTSENGCTNGCWHRHLDFMRTMQSDKQTSFLIGNLRKRDDPTEVWKCHVHFFNQSISVVANSSTWSHMVERKTKTAYFQSIKSERFLWLKEKGEINTIRSWRVLKVYKVTKCNQSIPFKNEKSP